MILVWKTVRCVSAWGTMVILICGGRLPCVAHAADVDDVDTVAKAPAQRDLIVAADGSGNYKTVQEAVDAVPVGNLKRVVIVIKPGIYKAHLVIPRDRPLITLRGEDARKTILTNDLHVKSLGGDGKEVGTIGSASVVVSAPDFTAENVTFENNAPHVAQALAVYIDADRAVFRQCRFLGWQDTIRVRSGRQYFDRCYINGRTDFIYGEATSFFDRCHIHVLEGGWITAANTPQDRQYGLVFSRCRITGEPGVKTYLGRPWRDYAHTVWLNTEMGDVIRPEGWHNWNKPDAEKTVRYAEYASKTPDGTPIDLSTRVPWSKRLTVIEAEKYTLRAVLGGTDSWNPALPLSTGESAAAAPRRSSITRTLARTTAWDSQSFSLDALAAKFPQSKEALPLIAQFPLLASLLETDGIWQHEPSMLRAQLLPEAVFLQQGSDRQPLLFSAQRSRSWSGLPAWGQLAYEVEYYCFDLARPSIKLHIGRPLKNVLHQQRVEAVAAARSLAADFPLLEDDARREVADNIEKIVAGLRPYGAARLPFKHPKIKKYLLPGGTRLTFSDLSGSLNGTVYMELVLEPAQPIADRLNTRLPAFPGAEGYGAFTPGGRGGKVYLVTTLEDYLPTDRPSRPERIIGQPSVPPPGYDPKQWVPYVDALGKPHPDQRRPILPGYPAIPKETPLPGSLRAAVAATGPRTIVFAVSGTIALKAPLVIRSPYVTIAGNTAPGEGVQIRNWGIDVETHDVILRYLRVRVGDTKGPGGMPRVLGDQTHALNLTGMNIIVDHCEFAYANDQIVNFYGKEDKRLALTFQWNYIYGGLLRSTHDKGPHSMTLASDGWGYVSMHHNLLAHSRTRNPRIWGLHFDYRNNTLYNYGGSGYGNENDYVRLNYIGNVQKRGDWAWGFQTDSPYAQFYAADNRMPEKSPYDLRVPPETRMTEPWESEPVRIQSAEAASIAVLLQGGASLPVRDSITEYVARTVRTNTGKIPGTTNDLPLGGYPSYRPTRSLLDSDSDGLPDTWEKKYGLNPRDPTDAIKDFSGDGYTNLEKYLWGIDPGRKVDWRRPENNRDTLGVLRGISRSETTLD